MRPPLPHHVDFSLGPAKRRRAPFNERTAGGLTRAQDSDERNLNVANQRAAAAADVLRAGDSNLEVTEVVWESFGEMTARRFRDRDEEDLPSDREYLNRSVDVVVQNISGCAAVPGLAEDVPGG